MKIERKDQQTILYFGEIEEGTVFISCDGDVYMRTGYIKDNDSVEECNAVLLETGELTFFEDHEFVTLPASAKLVVE